MRNNMKNGKVGQFFQIIFELMFVIGGLGTVVVLVWYFLKPFDAGIAARLIVIFFGGFCVSIFGMKWPNTSGHHPFP
jgi:hypothetical protein